MGRRRQRLHRARLAAKRQEQTTTTNPTVGIENSVVQEMLTKTTAAPVTETPVEIEETTPIVETITPSPAKTTPTRMRAAKKTPAKRTAKRTTKRRTNTNTSK